MMFIFKVTTTELLQTMLKWVSRSSNLETDKTLQHGPESPSQFPASYTTSPELFFSPRGDLSSGDSPARMAPVFQLSSSASLDSGVGSSSSSSTSSLRCQSPAKPGNQSDSLDFLSISSVMLSLPCLLQFPVMTAERGGLVFILIYSLVLVLVVWPSLYLQVIVSRLFTEGAGVSPLCGGLTTCLLLVSLLVTASYSLDTATALFYLQQAASQPSPLPWAPPSHHHHSPTFLTRDLSLSPRHSRQSPQRQFWERKVKQEDSQINLELLVSSLVVWSLLLLLLTVLLGNLSRLRRFLNLSHLLVLSLTSVLLLKSLTVGDPWKVWRQLTPDLTSLSDPETWSSALVLAGLSTNLTTGSVTSLTRGKVSRHINTNILASLASHLAACLLFSFTVMSLRSEEAENVYVVITESLSSPAWVVTALVVVTVLGLHSVLTTLSVSLAFLQQTYQSPARLYPSLVCLGLLSLSLSLLPHWSSTAGYSQELTVWTVEKFSFLVQAFILASLTWGLGLDTIAERMSAAGGGELSRFYHYYAGIAPMAFLLLTVYLSVSDIEERDLTVGCLVLLVMTVSLFLSSAALVINKVRRGKQKHLGWSQIWVGEILGRRAEEVRDNSLTSSLTNSYKKYERCDLTSTTCQAHWQYKNKDGRF